MWALAIKFGLWALGIFFPAKDERDTERAAGEKLGQQETENASAQKDLTDTEKSVAAANSERAADAADSSKLLDGTAHGARKWKPGPD